MTEPLAPTTIGERQAIAEAIRKAKAEADKTYGVARHHLEEISRVELIIAALPTPTTNAPVADREEKSIVDQARGLMVYTLRDAARQYAPTENGKGSYEYLAGMATKVEQAEAVAIDSYLVLDCVIAALRQALPIHGEMREALERIDQFVTKFRQPWGSWKTVWWEGEVSDEAAFSADNALMHVANIARNALTSNTGSSS